MAAFIHTRVADLSNFYVALAWSVPAFLLVTAVAG
jgi:hypothetical protein